jgi:hypothetical protein
MAEGGFFSPLVGGLLGGASGEPTRPQDQTSQKLLEEFVAVYGDLRNRRWSASVNLKISDVGKQILELNSAGQLRLLMAAYGMVMDYEPRRRGGGTVHQATDVFRLSMVKGLVSTLIRKPLPFEEPDLVLLLKGLASSDARLWLPASGVLRAVEKKKEAIGFLAPEVRLALENLEERVEDRLRRSPYKADQEIIERTRGILHEGMMPPPSLKLEPGEAWADAAIDDLGRMPPEKRNAWADLLAHAQSGDGSKPTKKWLAEASKLMEPIGKEDFCSRLPEWTQHLGKRRTQEVESLGESMPDRNLLLTDESADILKGLMWCCSGMEDVRLARAVGDAAVACYKKVTWHGPMNKKVGNAAVAALSSMPGTEAAAQLGRLNTSVKHKSARKFVARRIEDVAERTGQTAADLAEVAVPTFDLDARGKKRLTLGEFTAEIAVTGSTDVELRWFRADGKEQKAVPAEVKINHPTELKHLQRTVKDIEKLLPAQRIRIERLLMGRRQWPIEAWRARFMDHPLVENLSRRLIWEFNSGAGWKTVGTLNGVIVGPDDHAITINEKTEVRLWHPIEASTEEISAWRTWLERHEITQPFKQAHREIYVVTEAERVTDTYSNRFAAHILRQHQFAALCAARGWDYRLQGRFDSHNVPTLRLPEHDLRVEFWVEPAEMEQTSGAGIFLYVVSDQVRFYRDQAAESIPVANVPPLLFTEIMRDVDLFAGVASMGNDPNWRDTGQRPDWNQYWQRVSFGELTETAKTRKAVLERLVPRLKHADRYSFEEKFLVVRGDLRTYKIHLGSGNILMEPGGTYLCIVPARGSSTDVAEGLILPFEGDLTLSIIISKAMMLAADKKIKDSTIRVQIGA